MRRYIIFLSVIVAVLVTSCGGKNRKEESKFPEKFNLISDSQRIDYMIENASPDSVARFIVLAALGKIEGAKIDSLGIATSYAYEVYSGSELDRFGEEYDQFVNSLPLADKMKIYVMAGVEDPQGLGLQLGLEYMQAIRENNLSVQDVEKEINVFKEACGEDSATYKRFIIGFRTVLAVDSGRDMPKDIYDRFITIE